MTVEFENYEYPYHLDFAAKCTGLINNSTLSFTFDTPQQFDSYSLLAFNIRLQQVIQGNIYVRFFNNEIPVSAEIPVALLSTLLYNYQAVAIDLSEFKISSQNYDKILFRYSGSQFAGFYIDYIRLQEGNITSLPKGWYFDVEQDNQLVRTLINPGDNVYLIGEDGITFSRETDDVKGNVIRIKYTAPQLIDDLNFDFRDIEAKAMTYVLVTKATFKFEIISVAMRCDVATSINGVAIKINNVAVTGLSNVTVNTNIIETNAIANNVVQVGDVITLTATGITGNPTELLGTLKRRRV